jgi:uncharacterized protein (DUF2237 family)
MPSSSRLRTTAADTRDLARTPTAGLAAAHSGQRVRRVPARRGTTWALAVMTHSHTGAIVGRSSRCTAKRHPAGRAATAPPDRFPTLAPAGRAWHALPMVERNVLGGPLEPCGTDPLTGFYRDGDCACGPEDAGLHAVCAVVTEGFLAHQRSVGNDLTTPRPEWNFPGLRPGDRWCVVAARWLQSYDAGAAAPVVLASTNARALEVVPIEFLREQAVDVPEDPRSLV